MGNTSILFILIIFYTIMMVRSMVKINIESLLKANKKTKYWLFQRMNMTSRNINRIIRGETTTISFKYIEEFCSYLNCTPGELITLNDNEENKKAEN